MSKYCLALSERLWVSQEEPLSLECWIVICSGLYHANLLTPNSEAIATSPADKIPVPLDVPQSNWLE